MKTAHVCFLWHMHQPYYVDRITRTASMPWVRLHAIKAYFDMAYVLDRVPGAHVTVNFTPSLLLQLDDLASGSVVDLFLEYTKRPAADLSLSEQAFLLRHFFAANWATMVRPYPRYHELLVKRGLDVLGQDLERKARDFTTQEWLDLQVWHTLAWFGYGAVARHPQLGAFRIKDRGFTEGHKRDLLDIQQAVIREVIPAYRRLAESGRIELTTTPFYHPILPLVIDTDLARRARPDLPMPSRFQAPADAEAQLQRAVALHTKLFGRPPVGLWPSEGSVCPEMIPLVRRAGLRWMATDEGVLARSLGHWHRPQDLYHPYRAEHGGEDVAVFFRDRELSDGFGFVYAKWTPDAAVDDVLHRLTAIVEHAAGDQVVIPIILDGENPWEHYHDGGERLLSGLYARLARGSLNTAGRQVGTATLGSVAARHPPRKRLNHLHSGSWINADFKIWIGHPEDNRGWEMLRETRVRLIEMERDLAPEQAHRAWDELYAAEGSDWFWWYGDDFQTEYKVEFDRLFRTHLRNVFLQAGKPVPDYLHQPVLDLQGILDVQPVRQPVRLLSPTIDGLVTSFFEWRGCGIIDPSPPLGAMWKASDLFTGIRFGSSVESLFLRLDLLDRAIRPGLTAEFLLTTPRDRYKVTVSLAPPGPDHFTLSRRTEQGWAEIKTSRDIARRKIVELAVPYKDLQLQSGEALQLSLVMLQDGLELERYPRHHAVAVTVPDETFDARMWRV
ncbi:glycoside hydrolase family 57 protein [Candidatus Nitrospira bockiana]